MRRAARPAPPRRQRHTSSTRRRRTPTANTRSALRPDSPRHHSAPRTIGTPRMPDLRNPAPGHRRRTPPTARPGATPGTPTPAGSDLACSRHHPRGGLPQPGAHDAHLDHPAAAVPGVHLGHLPAAPGRRLPHIAHGSLRPRHEHPARRRDTDMTRAARRLLGRLDPLGGPPHDAHDQRRRALSRSPTPELTPHTATPIRNTA